MALEIGKTYNIEGVGKVKIEKATEKGKAKSAVQLSTGKRINFGDPDMRNAPGTKRGNQYCERSGSLNERGFNANTLSREDWNCSGGKSKDSCNKYDQVMKEFDKGNLKDKYGRVVTSRKDAEKIAYSESGKM